jgi:hypothetical protein
MNLICVWGAPLQSRAPLQPSYLLNDDFIGEMFAPPDHQAPAQAVINGFLQSPYIGRSHPIPRLIPILLYPPKGASSLHNNRVHLVFSIEARRGHPVAAVAIQVELLHA